MANKMNRNDFVNTVLSACVAGTGRYAGTRMVDKDTVELVCNNGYTYRVNVCGDSNQGIMADVLKEMNRH